ncbi:TonB-dependent receptor plug domain-containing protein [Caulobacter sp.]|uniref:TonB-dependent receptor plug domain-containing protein n=1 Tax=Caulobacter sp. TaxID=78 RepID=UPI0031D78DBF
MRIERLAGLCGSTAVAAVLAMGGGAQAQTSAAADNSTVSEIVVTGSRIPRSNTQTAAPVTVLTQENLEERGAVNVGELLNQVTSNTPVLPISTSQGFPAGDGKQSPNLFNLGAGRTLTLVNGRRMVATSSGLGDRVVDAGVIPTGLIQRVDIVQGGGASVYGSDAIAGVVNYILKDHFQGLELDAQYGESTRGDYPKRSLRATWGKNFAEGRGNIAMDLSWSKTDALLESDRPATSNGLRNVTNPANTSTTDGIAPTMYVFDGHLWQYNRYGVIWATPNGTSAGLLRSGGTALQFSPDGQSVIPYDTGVIQGTSSTAVGGQGLDTRDLSTLAAGQERYNFTTIGHFDITPHIKASGELLYSHQQSNDPYGTQSIFRTIGNTGAYGPITFNNTNPFLSASDIATLSAASPTFAAGGNLSMTRFMDILPSRNRETETDVYRVAGALDGDFNLWNRDFTWSASASRAVSDYQYRLWAPYLSHLQNALSAVKNSAGEIVCSINADAITTNDDAACAPLNPFGQGNESAAARAYVSTLTGIKYHNVQDDFLVVLGGDLIKLPAGPAKFSAAYEHRKESTQYRPSEADRTGIATTGSPLVNRDASFSANEYSGELLIPVLGGDFTLPGVKALELNGSYRYVDHSIAGTQKVWGYGGRWDTGLGLAFRASKSRNFRAPSLDQLFAPRTTSTGNPLGTDPCDADRINSGANPAQRLANCQKEFAAHPEYGPLATFQDPAESSGLVTITSGGNPDLKNEISNTTTWGVIFQPKFIPGLTITADRVEVALTDGLVSFTAATFAANCYDLGNADACATFTRNAQGYITQAQSMTFNAGLITWNGDIWNINYRFPLGGLWGKDLGQMELGAEVTHTTRYDTSTNGTTHSRTDDTTSVPDIRARFDVRWSKGPLRLFYSAYYLPEEPISITDTIETTPVPMISSNTVHNVSAQYNWRNYTFRAGVNNFTDESPSFPTRTYGDVLGRQFYLGLRARY